jgi:hypothetical protein
MKLIYLAVGGLLIATASACSSPSHAADPRPAPAPASTTVPANPYAVPPVITVAYVDSVLKALNHVYGNAERLEKATNSVNASAVADLRSIYSGPQLDTELQVFQEALSGSLGEVRPDPGDRVFAVTDLESSNSSCVAAVVDASYSAVDLSSSSPKLASVVLQTKRANAESGSLNPTPWAITYEEEHASTLSCQG